MKLKVEPTKEHKIPYDSSNDESDSFLDELKVTANTQELLEQLGGPPELDQETAEKSAKLLKAAVENKDKNALTTPGVAFAAREFLRVYSSRLAVEMNDVRSALTNKLLELANCGDARYELKAIELLGKHSDIALFTERSEVTVNYKTSDDLENAIKERVKRLLNADVIDVTPVTPYNLDDELGIAEPKQNKNAVEPDNTQEDEEVQAEEGIDG